MSWSLEVLELAARGRPLSELLSALVRAMQASIGSQAIGSILLLDEDGSRLRHGAAPDLPDAYCSALDGVKIGPRVGSCGTAAFRGEAVLVADIATDPLWIDFRDLALSHGLRACWSMPIRSSISRIAGTFAFYYRECREPDAKALALVERAGSVAGLLIERHRSYRALKEAETRYRQLVELSPDAVFVHSNWRVVMANASMLRLFGASEASELVGQELIRLVAPESRAQVRERVEQLYAGTSTVPAAEVTYLRADGSRFAAEVSASSFDLLGRRAAQVVARDVSARKRADDAWRASEARFRALVEMSSDFYWRTDKWHRLVELEYGAAHRPITPKNQLLGHARWEIPSVHPKPEGWRTHRATLDARLPFRDFEFARTDDRGMVRWYSTSGDPVRAADGEFLGYQGIGREITARRDADKALQRSEARFRALTALSSDWYWELDAELRFSFVSDGYSRVRGSDPAALIGKRRWELDSLASIEEMARHRAILEGRLPFIDFTYARRGADGRVTWASHSGEPVFDDTGSFTGYRGIARDVTAKRHAEDELARLAHYDSLTGLPNRALLEDRVRQATARADRSETLLGVLFLDLDHFKEINDTLGHAFGDQVLKLVADRLRGCLRGTDTVARLGGDEFTVLVEGMRHVDEVRALAKKILKALRKRASIGGHDVYLSTSIGVTIYPFDDREPDVLLRNADMALYRAKQDGRNILQFYTHELTESTARRQDLQTRMRRAMERGDFTLHYQPQIDIGSGAVVGLEALLRWHDPERGQIGPAQFIPVAEESGLIVKLGEWVLREACRQCRIWHDAGLGPLTIAVNLSPRQFRQKDLVETVAKVLADTGLPPDCLELEITESTAMHRADEAIESMQRLCALGVQISMDDFGTGYSSLAYLQLFPVRTLKVDQSFVRCIGTPGESVAIAGAVIDLARALGMRTVAEGVERVGQLEFLRARGCDIAQGYHFCRPQAAGEIEKFLRSTAAKREIMADA